MVKKILKISITVLVATAVAAFSFVAGFAVERCSATKEVSSYEWALKTIKDYYYFGEPDIGYTETSLKAIADIYLDRYSEYYTKEEYAEVQKSNAGSKSGIGISYSFVNGKGVYISKVVGNSSAYESGLRAGDWIKSATAEDGESVTFTSSASFSDFISSTGDGVNIVLESDSGSFTVKKKEYTATYTYMSTNSMGWTVNLENGLPAVAPELALNYLPDKCAYIRLDQFYGTAASEFYKLVEQFNSSHCTSLILDLRSNGGGYVSIMQEIAGCFAGGRSRLAMLSRDKKGGEERFNCKKVTDERYRIGSDVEVFVLANAGTASASEALIGAMVCYDALEYENIFLSQYGEEYINWLYPTGQDIKNGRTYGKGIMQTPFTNSRTGEVLKLTTAQIFWPDTVTSIHDKGITEDGDCYMHKCTPVPAEWEWTKGDKELQSAVGIIKNRI